MKNAALTVGELVMLLSDLPHDREVYVSDDSVEYPMNCVVPDHDVWIGEGGKTKPVVLITWDLPDVPR